MSKKILLSVWLSIFLNNLCAQNDSLPRPLLLDEVVVVAMKVPMPERSTSKPVQVISQQTISRNLGKDLVQLINQEVGIIMNGAFSNPGKNKEVYTRGGSSKYTLILIDGIPVNDASDVGAVFDLRLLPLYKVERIEILKGSQSTLYGSGAIAGVINIITRSQEGKPWFTASAGFGSLKTRRVSFDLAGTLKSLGYDFSFGHYATDGISEAAEDIDTVNFVNDPSERNFFQTSFDWDISEKLRFSPFVRYSNFTGGYDDGPFMDAPNRYNSEMINPGMRLSYEASKTMFIVVLYHYLQSDRNFNSSFGENAFMGRTHNADVFGNVTLNNKIRLLGGILFQKAEMLDDMALEPDPSYEIVSPYITFLASGLGNWNLELGSRLNYHSDFGLHSSISVAPSYDLASNLRLFASLTTGFKSPTLNQLYGQFGPNPSLNPEKSWSYEFGILTSSLIGQLQMQLTFYERSIADIITYDFVNGYQNQNQQDDFGVELLANYRLNNKIRFSVNYDYVDGALTETMPNGMDTTYYNLIRRPRHALHLGVDISPISNIYLAFNGHWYSDRIDYFFNPNNFFIREEVNMDPYVLLNMHIEYLTPNNRLRIYCDIKNILDGDYAEAYGFSTLKRNVQLGLLFNLFKTDNSS